MTRTPSDCIDHGPPHLSYVTCEGQSEPIVLTIVETEGGARHRYQITDGRWWLLISDAAAKLAGRPK